MLSETQRQTFNKVALNAVWRSFAACFAAAHSAAPTLPDNMHVSDKHSEAAISEAILLSRSDQPAARVPGSLVPLLSTVHLGSSRVSSALELPLIPLRLTEKMFPTSSTSSQSVGHLLEMFLLP
jgi:hypothetical protein